MSIGTSSLPTPLVWFITGTSQGFGRELVRLALAQGDSVAATSRDPAKVATTFPDAGERLLPTALDLHDPASIKAAVDDAVARFGRIDVLVNNTGHGIIGALEEVSDEELAASSADQTPLRGLKQRAAGAPADGTGSGIAVSEDLADFPAMPRTAARIPGGQ